MNVLSLQLDLPQPLDYPASLLALLPGIGLASPATSLFSKFTTTYRVGGLLSRQVAEQIAESTQVDIHLLNKEEWENYVISIVRASIVGLLAHRQLSIQRQVVYQPQFGGLQLENNYIFVLGHAPMPPPSTVTGALETRMLNIVKRWPDGGPTIYELVRAVYTQDRYLPYHWLLYDLVQSNAVMRGLGMHLGATNPPFIPSPKYAPSLTCGGRSVACLNARIDELYPAVGQTIDQQIRQSIESRQRRDGGWYRLKYIMPGA